MIKTNIMNDKRYPAKKEDVKVLAEAAAKCGFKLIGVRGGLIENNETDKLQIAVEKSGLKALLEYDDNNTIKPYKAGKTEFMTMYAALGFISENSHKFVNEDIENKFQSAHMKDEMKQKEIIEERTKAAHDRYDKQRAKHNGVDIMKRSMTEEELKRGFQLNR